MAFNEEIIIELREQNAYTNNNNGDYQVSIEPTPLYNGDTLEIKSCYIDSVEANQGDIIVEDDGINGGTEVSLSFASYITNWNATSVPAKVYLTNDPQPDLKPYFACKKVVAPNMAQVFAVAEMRLYRENSSVNGGKWGRPADQPALTLNFKYKDPNGEAGVFVERRIQLKEQDGSSDHAIFNHSTNPNLFPFFISGTPIDIENAPGFDPAIVWTNPTDVLPSDNLNEGAIKANNRPGEGGGLKTWYNIYAGSNFVKLVSFTYQNQSGGAVSFGNGAKITIQYQDWKDGATKQATITCTGANTGTHTTLVITPNIDMIKGGQTISRPFTDSLGIVKYLEPLSFPQDCPLNEVPFNILTQDEDDNANFFMEGFTFAQATIDLTANILLFTERTIIPAGSYPVAQLCEILTEAFTSLTAHATTFTTYPTNNWFLTTNNQLRVLNGLTALQQMYYVSYDGASFFTWGSLTPTTDAFIGSSQVDFENDAELNKIKIGGIHSSLFGANTFTPIIQYAGKGGGGSELIGRNGGVVFTDMQPQSFWEACGFNYDNDTKIFASPLTQHTTIAGTGFLTESMPIDIGRYTTTANSGLDNAILKKNPYIFTGLGALNTSGGGSVQSNVNIIAPNSIAQSSDNDGYFMVEIGGIPNSNIIGSKGQLNKVQSIISRFYQSGSYTTSYNEGSSPIVYRGEPTTLSNFSVRILNARGELSNDIQNKSTIFLQLTRASPQQN